MPPGIARTCASMAGSCHPADGDAAGWRSGPRLYCPPVSDLPLTLPDDSATVLRSALDRERKIDAALDRLGPLADRDVLVLGGGAGRARAVRRARRPRHDRAASDALAGRRRLGRHDRQRLVGVPRRRPRRAGRGGPRPPARAAGCSSSTTTAGTTCPACAATSSSTATGPGATGRSWPSGFRLRVIHCFWTFDSIDDGAGVPRRAPSATRGEVVGAGLKRPRLSYNVAVYHRTRGGTSAGRARVAGAGADA